MGVPEEDRDVMVKRVANNGVHDVKEQNGELSTGGLSWGREWGIGLEICGHFGWFWVWERWEWRGFYREGREGWYSQSESESHYHEMGHGTGLLPYIYRSLGQEIVSLMWVSLAWESHGPFFLFFFEKFQITSFKFGQSLIQSSKFWLFQFSLLSLVWFQCSPLSFDCFNLVI